jgi:hypothetical protein
MGSAIRLFSSTTKLVAAALIAAGCGSLSAEAQAAAGSQTFVWPESFVTLGNGFPHAGDACRRLGESSATANYLDHMAMLVGCPGSHDSKAVREILHHRPARVVGETDGVTLISISTESGGGMSGQSSQSASMTDANFSATGTLPCERDNGQTKTLCRFGVVRHSDRSATVVVYWPDGGTRVIFFAANGRVLGTGAKADDRPMPGNTITQKSAGVSLISVGSERYEIADKVLSGS